MASCLHAEERVGGPREGSARTGRLEVDGPALEDAGQAGSSFSPVMGERRLQPASPRWWATRPAVKPDDVSQGKRKCRTHSGACGNGASGKEPPGWAAWESSPPGPYSARRGNESSHHSPLNRGPGNQQLCESPTLLFCSISTWFVNREMCGGLSASAHGTGQIQM